jgi:hypothetical protein
LSPHRIERSGQAAHGPVWIVQFLEAEQSDAETAKSAGSSHCMGTPAAICTPMATNFLPDWISGIVGIADDDAGRLEAFRGDALEALAAEQLANPATEFLLLLADALKTVLLGFEHHVTQACQGVGRHRRVVGKAAFLVGLHDLQPLLEVAGKTAAGGCVDARTRALAKRNQRAARGAAPAFLRRADQYVDVVGDHIDPDGPGGDAIKNEEAINGTNGGADGTQVIVGSIKPEAVSTCGAKTISGFSAWMLATTSSIGGGANAACGC